LRSAGHLEVRVEVDPTRGNPLLVSVQPNFCVETLMHNLARDQLRQQQLPLIILRIPAYFAFERLITKQESLRQIE